MKRHELTAVQFAAGRDKDWPLLAALLQYSLVDATELCARLASLPLPPERIGTLVRGVEARS